jgi:Zinc finger, C3HC4 type (RING finger)
MICSLTYNKLGDKMELSNPQNIFRSVHELSKWVQTNIRGYDIKLCTIIACFSVFSYFVGSKLMKDIKIKLEERHNDKLRSKLENGDKLLLEKIECIICMKNIRSIVSLPCKHVSMCSTCHESMPGSQKDKCPICKVDINGVVRLYIA